MNNGSVKKKHLGKEFRLLSQFGNVFVKSEVVLLYFPLQYPTGLTPFPFDELSLALIFRQTFWGTL